jgi:hypothetical protein
MALVVLAVLSGCEGRKPEKTFADPQLEALKKAREVEEKLQAGAEKTREAADSAAQGGGGY